ncbi:hypothetical protein IWW50_000927 [Coemansia erecta]|nr:hypothetical protein GGF43_005831 [Coemansia sp. RSA 2618]KAJ2829318.1 hypothetical protein IWW50_000927 [Coemansia erecta]
MDDGSFFSFLSDEPRVDSQPPVDDFISQHIVTPKESSPHTISDAPGSPHAISDAPGSPHAISDAPTSADLTHNNHNSRRKLESELASSDSVHPLIRNRRLETPEDIAAWIAERKSKYPTDANVRLKSEHPVDAKRKHGDVENPLSALANYGDADSSSSSSDDESSDNDAPDIAPAKSQTAPVPFRPSGMAPNEDRRKLRVCRFFARGACAKGSRCPFAHPEPAHPNKTDADANGEPPAMSNTKHASLLAMLMAKDIDRENYRVWQCIDHICRNNFLDIQPHHRHLLD